MVGFKIFKLCFMQVLRSWKMTLRLGLPWVAVVLAGYALLGGLGLGSQILTGSGPGAGFFVIILAFAIFCAFGIMSVAIGWHRYVLTGQSDTFMYLFQPGARVGWYFWRSLLIGLLVTVIFVPLAFLFGNLVQLLVSSPTDLGRIFWLNLASTLIIGVISTWLFLRFGLTLPATAMDKQIRIFESFGKTSSVAGALFVTALCLVALQAIPALLTIPVMSLAGAAGGLFILPVTIIMSWFYAFISIGVLTVLYGHLVEGRPIDL